MVKKAGNKENDERQYWLWVTGPEHYFDDHGNETEPAWPSRWPNFAAGDRVVGWAFANYPRRARRVGLKIIDYNPIPPPRVIAEFTVRNPGPREHPTWRARPFPIVQRSGELSCTLVNWTAGRPVRSRPGLYVPYHANWNTAVFQVTDRGAPAPAWSWKPPSRPPATWPAACCR